MMASLSDTHHYWFGTALKRTRQGGKLVDTGLTTRVKVPDAPSRTPIVHLPPLYNSFDLFNLYPHGTFLCFSHIIFALWDLCHQTGGILNKRTKGNWQHHGNVSLSYFTFNRNVEEMDR